VLNEKVGDRLPERRGLVAEAEVAPTRGRSGAAGGTGRRNERQR
jgi:hypothetical protein